MAMTDIAVPEDLKNRTTLGPDELVACGWGYGYWAPYPRLPTGPLLLFDQVTHFTFEGGDNGKGFVEATLDIHPDLWFFEHHFVGDPVMPGTLQKDVLYQLSGLALGLAGARGKGRAKSSGDELFPAEVRPTAKLLRYRVDIEHMVVRPETSVIRTHGFAEVDGVRTCEAKAMKVRVFPLAA